MAPAEVAPPLEGKRDFADNYVERLAGCLLPPSDGGGWLKGLIDRFGVY